MKLTTKKCVSVVVGVLILVCAIWLGINLFDHSVLAATSALIPATDPRYQTASTNCQLYTVKSDDQYFWMLNRASMGRTATQMPTGGVEYIPYIQWVDINGDGLVDMLWTKGVYPENASYVIYINDAGKGFRMEYSCDYNASTKNFCGTCADVGTNIK